MLEFDTKPNWVKEIWITLNLALVNKKTWKILKNISQCRSPIFFYWNISIIYFHLYVIVWPPMEKDGTFIFIHVYLLFTTFYLQRSAIHLLSITSTVSDCWQMGGRSTPTAILMDFQKKEGTIFFFFSNIKPLPLQFQNCPGFVIFFV